MNLKNFVMYSPKFLLIYLTIFAVSCGGDSGPTGSNPITDNEPTTGAIEVITKTTGKDKDDGYTITANGTNNTSADSSDTVYLTGLEEGSYDIELSNIAENCSPDGKNPRRVNVTSGDTTSTAYSINCKDVIRNQIAFASNRSGGADENFEIYLMNTNGSSPQRITNNSDNDSYPSISPNGQHIAFAKRDPSTNDFDLFVMDADGSNSQLIISGTSLPFVSWSPDGKKIAFSNSNNGNYEIYTADSDGANPVNISKTDSVDFIGHASWSPDGKKLLFTSDRGPGTDNEIYTCNTDGTGVIQITDNNVGEVYASWSPDGDHIAYSSFESSSGGKISIINADGTGSRLLAETGTSFAPPTWSPDGTEIAFQRTLNNSNIDIIKINADGSGPETNLTSDPSQDSIPYWSPVDE